MMRFRLWIILVTGLYLSACSTTYYLPDPPHLYTADNPYASIAKAGQQTTTNKIIYVTDRDPELTKDGQAGFGNERSRHVRFGTADVSIGEDQSWTEIADAAQSDSPRVKIQAELAGITASGIFPETPMNFTVNNGKITIDPEELAANTEARQALTALIREQMQASQKREAVVFIHGYKTGFREAVLTANDIYHYTGQYAVPISYTWPSNDGNNLFGYFQDRSSSDFTIFHLKEFLRTLMDMPDLDRIHVIAHSLGTDVTTTALRELIIETRAAGINPREKFKIENLVLAAPDLDYGVVTQRLIAERIGPAFGRITVYTNAKDRALGLSKFLQGGLRFGQLTSGQERPQEIEIFKNIKNVSFINVSGAKQGFFNHAYFTQDPATFSDIITLIKDPTDPGTEKRPLEKLESNFWKMDSETYLKTAKPPS